MIALWVKLRVRIVGLLESRLFPLYRFALLELILSGSVGRIGIARVL